MKSAFLLTLCCVSVLDIQKTLPESVVVLSRPHYVSQYDNRAKNPLWVYGRLDKTGGEVRVNSFHEDKDIRECFRALNSDYTDSGYDRGHCEPAGDHARDAEDMKSSFLLSNMVPQVPHFNRGIWSRLEAEVREMGPGTDVITVPLYLPSGGKIEIKVIGRGVWVPTHMGKTVRTTKGVIKCWIIPNKEVTGKPDDYLINEDDFETKAGFLVWEDQK
jgi:endonuclease G